MRVQFNLAVVNRANINFPVTKSFYFNNRAVNNQTISLIFICNALTIIML